VSWRTCAEGADACCGEHLRRHTGDRLATTKAWLIDPPEDSARVLTFTRADLELSPPAHQVRGRAW
jgi:hypothetical protein